MARQCFHHTSADLAAFVTQGYLLRLWTVEFWTRLTGDYSMHGPVLKSTDKIPMNFPLNTFTKALKVIMKVIIYPFCFPCHSATLPAQCLFITNQLLIGQ